MRRRPQTPCITRRQSCWPRGCTTNRLRALARGMPTLAVIAARGPCLPLIGCIGLGLVGKDAVDAANADGMGSVGNPVTSITIENGQLVVVYADGATTREDLPAGTGGGNLRWPGL